MLFKKRKLTKGDTIKWFGDWIIVRDSELADNNGKWFEVVAHSAPIPAPVHIINVPQPIIEERLREINKSA